MGLLKFVKAATQGDLQKAAQEALKSVTSEDAAEQISKRLGNIAQTALSAGADALNKAAANLFQTKEEEKCSLSVSICHGNKLKAII